MKKVCLILAITLLSGFNVDAKSINLICDMKSSQMNQNGNIQYDDVSKIQDQVLVIDLSKRKLLDYGITPGMSEQEYENIEINDKTIEWGDNLENFGRTENILNRISGQLISSTFHDKNSNIYKTFGISFIQMISDCKMKEKKF